MKKIPRQHTHCLNCGRDIYYIPSQLTGKYCSTLCHSLHKSTEVVCKGCSKKFRTPNARLRQNKAFYCNRDCYHKYTNKGYRYKNKEGYVFLLKPKRILEHRYIMEQHLKRTLKNDEEIHHKNGIKDDNRIENLEVVLRKMHFGNVECPYCQNHFKVK